MDNRTGGAMSAYTSDEVFEIVKKHLTSTVDTIDPSKVTRESSMKALGANSLDIVEVVSCSMREIKVRVPREALSTLKNIGDLSDLLYKVHAEKAAS
jgi:acyl carrier protein